MIKSDPRLVILAGGVSSRMKRTSSPEAQVDSGLAKQADERTKGMIGVGEQGRPFLDYMLNNAKKAGINDVTIVIGERDNAMRQYYGEKDSGNDFHGIQISYAVQRIPAGREKPMGTADALYQAVLVRPDWKGGDFIVCNSDNLYSLKVLEALRECEAPNAYPDYDRSGLEFNQDRIAGFGITKRDTDGYLLEIVEKPSVEEIERLKDPQGVIRVSMNIFRLNYDMIFPLLEHCPITPKRQEKELVVAVTNLVNANRHALKLIPWKEHVPDLTYKDDIIMVQEWLKIHYPVVEW
ncbi:MAG: sugar phosphate nucleotidyltransferase [bacterium]